MPDFPCFPILITSRTLDFLPDVYRRQLVLPGGEENHANPTK